MPKSRSEDRGRSDSPPTREIKAGSRRSIGYASPPCFLHEVDPSYMGHMSHEEVILLLNMLLDGEHAIQRDIRDAIHAGLGGSHRQSLSDTAKESAHICKLLAGHIERLGKMQKPLTGMQHELLHQEDSASEAISKVHQRRSFLIEKLREELPKIFDDVLRGDLDQIIRIYQDNR